MAMPPCPLLWRRPSRRPLAQRRALPLHLSPLPLLEATRPSRDPRSCAFSHAYAHRAPWPTVDGADARLGLHCLPRHLDTLSRTYDLPATAQTRRSHPSHTPASPALRPPWTKFRLFKPRPRPQFSTPRHCPSPPLHSLSRALPGGRSYAFAAAAHGRAVPILGMPRPRLKTTDSWPCCDSLPLFSFPNTPPCITTTARSHRALFLHRNCHPKLASDICVCGDRAAHRRRTKPPQDLQFRQKASPSHRRRSTSSPLPASHPR